MVPKSFDALRTYSLDDFRHDILSGATVGLVALPLAMAFAISSGLPPQAGLYCAVVAGFLVSALGGSRYQIGGPTGAFVVIVAGIVAQHGVDGLLTATLLAGIILVVLGLTGFGSAIKFIPHPVVLGFTNGIAVVIASTQLRDFFGIEVDNLSGAFIPRIRALVSAAPSWSPVATALAIGCVAFLVIWRRYIKRVPGYVVVLALSTLAVALFDPSIETIGTRFGGIPSGLPQLQMPTFQLALILPLLRPAVTIALLGAVESLMSAVVADRATDDRHEPNMELVAQGVANLAMPFVGGMPATGAIARTGTNIRSGARTPVSGMMHAVTLALVLLVAAPLTRFVPLAALAAILLVVSYQIGEWDEIKYILRLTKADIAVWFTTFALTVLADLTVAVEVGMILAMLMFIRKVSMTTTVSKILAQDVADGRLHVLEDPNLPDYVAVFRIHGPLLFGATDPLRQISDRARELPPIVMLKLRYMTAIDATGLRALEDLADTLKSAGRELILCGAQPQPAALMRQAQFDEHIGSENLCRNTTDAMRRAAVLNSRRTTFVAAS